MNSKEKLVLLAFLIMFSCSKEKDSKDTDNNTEDLVLCTSWSKEYQSGPYDNEVLNFSATYSGNKIISSSRQKIDYIGVTNDYTIVNEYSTHIYNGELQISTRRSYQGEGDYLGIPLKNIQFLMEYEYNDDDLLVKQTRTAYNLDEAISSYQLFYTWTNNNLTRQEKNSEGQLYEVINFDNNRNPIEVIQYSYSSPGQIFRIITSTYDYTKNSPFMNTTSFYPFYNDELEVNKTYGNPLISNHYSNTDCTYYEEPIYNDNGFQISSVRTSSCDSDYLLLYNWYYN